MKYEDGLVVVGEKVVVLGLMPLRINTCFTAALAFVLSE